MSDHDQCNEKAPLCLQGTETSASVFISNILLILSNSVVGLSVGDLVITVTSVTSVSTLTSAQTSLLVELGKITLS